MDLTPCVFPKGLLNGHCVECPVDTLYEYVESYSYQIVGTGFWKQTIRKDESYHRCVKVCSPKYPYISSNRKCASRCAGNTVQRGNMEYCRDENINNGFCNVNDCPVQEYKCYFIQCFTECPAFTVIYNNSCVIECFDDKPFIVNGECVEQCPEGYVLDNGVCQLRCSSGRYLLNKTCVEKCPRNKEYVSDRVCVSECPISKLYQKKLCVNNCSESFTLDGRVCRTKCLSGRFEFEKRCVETCPESTLNENQKCVNNCSSGFFQFDNHCVSACPHNYFVKKSNKTCVKMCEGVTYYKNNTVFCLNDCPEKTVEVNSTCLSHCPKRQPFLHGMSCFSRCPDLYRFVKKKIGLDNSLTYMCVKQCTKYSSSISNLCVDACSLGEVLFKEICQTQCPNSDSYKVHLPSNSLEEELNISMSFNVTSPINAFVVCATECPSNFVMDNGECFVKCPSAKRNVIFNSTCLQHCPKNYPFIVIEDDKNMCTNHCVKLRFQQTCLDKCPNSYSAIHKGECIRCTKLGMYEQNQTCVNKCDFVRLENRCYNICPQNATYIYNKTCVKACPSNANTVDNQNREGYIHLVCTDKCPSDKFISGNNCVSNCPDRKRLPVDGQCMACHEVGKYDDGSKCVDICQDLHHEYRCVEKCPKNFKIFNKTCVVDCPVTAPIQIRNFWDYSSPYKCVQSCNKGEFVYKNRCVYRCDDYDYFIFKNTCVETCPQDARFISKSKGYNDAKECVSQCKETEVSLNFTCNEKCPDGYYGNEHQCIRSCPTNNPYKYGKRCVKSCQSLRVGMNCYDHCPYRTYQYNKTCVQNCPLTKPYNYNDKCVEDCPFFLIKKRCYEQCPSGLLGYKSKCLLQCPAEAKYRYKWGCFNNCPNNTILYSKKSTCFDSCPPGKLKYQQICYDQCPMQAPYNSIGECVESCDGYLDGLECYKQCPPRLFLYNEKCLPKCPEKASFVDNQNCVTFCPFVHDDHHNCMKECPENTYPDGKRCKSGCPPSLPFKDSIYESKCIEKCASYELATENNRCISSSDCSGFIYYSWCFQKCPSNIYLLRSGDKKYCKSLIPVYIMIGILTFFVITAISFGIRVFYHCNKLRRVSFNY